MSSAPLPQSFKLVVVGDSSTGKTSILERLLNNSFQSDNFPTIGIEFKSYLTNVDGQQVKLNLWDTAGQERYRAVAKSYFRNASGALLVFSIADYESFANVEKWLADLQAGCLPNAVFLLVGNKTDLADRRQVTEEEAKTLAARHGLDYIETSAKTSSNITEAFARITMTICNRVKSGSLESGSPPPTSSGIETNQQRPQKKSCC